MALSRLRRFEEKRAKKRLFIALVGSVALLAFVTLFGFKLLIGFSLLIDRIRGSSPIQNTQQNILIPPVLDPLPEATNSATITVNGKATPKLQVIMYKNDTEYKKLSVSDDGTFTVSDIVVEEGTVTISAKTTDTKGTISDLSNVISTTIDRTPPYLEVTTPADNAVINDGTHTVTVQGKTDEDAKVTINERIVITRADGSFRYSFPIVDGGNDLHIVASDPAGNQTTMTRHVTYQP